MTNTVTTTTNMIYTITPPTDIPTETPINNPTDFPIGSRINVINHLKYGGKHGIVKGHTQKFVTVEISNMDKAIRIHPKFLQHCTNDQTFLPIGDHTAAHRQLSMPKVMKKKKSEEPDNNNIKSIYERLIDKGEWYTDCRR
jgi:hypothetical protein